MRKRNNKNVKDKVVKKYIIKMKKVFPPPGFEPTTLCIRINVGKFCQNLSLHRINIRLEQTLNIKIQFSVAEGPG